MATCWRVVEGRRAGGRAATGGEPLGAGPLGPVGGMGERARLVEPLGGLRQTSVPRGWVAQRFAPICLKSCLRMSRSRCVRVPIAKLRLHITVDILGI